jgi:glutathionyl-hydroquinone reductase
MEGDEFILGFSGGDMPMATHLRSSQHRGIIEQCISDAVKKKVRLRIIEGTTLADYDNFKKLKAMAEASRSTMSDRREQERQLERAWEELAEKVTRSYARLELRQLAQTRAAFMRQAFEMINEAVNRVGYTNESEEAHKRGLGRVFEKLSTVMEVPSTMLAYEFFRLRDEGKLS